MGLVLIHNKHYLMQQRSSQHENVNHVVWDNQLGATINTNRKTVKS